MTDSGVRISIITAVYNNREFVRECLDSISSQRYKNLEHVVVDGGSTDGTLEVLQDNICKNAVFVSEPDRGICDAWNKGFALASGDVIGFLHSDDVFFDELSLTRIASLFDDKEVDVVYSDLLYVSRDGKNVIRRWQAGEFDPDKIKHGWMPPHPTLFVRRYIYDVVGNFDVSYRISGDYLSILKILQVPSLGIRYCPNFLVKMRYGGVSSKPSNYLRKMKEDYKALRTVGFSWATALFIVFKKNLRKVPQFF